MVNEVNWVRSGYKSMRDGFLELGYVGHQSRFMIKYDPKGWLEDDDQSYGLWQWTKAAHLNHWERVGWFTWLSQARAEATDILFQDKKGDGDEIDSAKK